MSIEQPRAIIPTDETVEKTVKNKLILGLTLIWVFLIGAIVAQLSSTYSIYVQTAFPSLGMNAISILFTLNSFLVVLFATPLGDYFGKFNKIWMTGVGGFLIGIGMCLLAFSYTFSLAILACVIYTIGEIIFFCVVQFICYQHGARKKGASLGLYRMVYATSRVAGPTAGGLIYHQFGGNMVWYISGLLGVLCLAISYHYRILEQS